VKVGGVKESFDSSRMILDDPTTTCGASVSRLHRVR
jgi:hypothetical protein